MRACYRNPMEPASACRANATCSSVRQISLTGQVSSAIFNVK